MKAINIFENPIFLIKVQFTNNNTILINGADSLISEIRKIEELDKGIEFIKIFDTSKYKFVNVSKNKIKSFVTSEADKLYLSSHYFFK